MTKARELGRRAGRAQRKAIRDDEREGFIGKWRDDGSVSAFGDSDNGDLLPIGQCYLTRYSEQLAGLETTVATCLTVTPKPRVGVWYREMTGGTLEVLRLNGKTAPAFLGEQVYDYSSPPKTGTRGTNLTSGRDFMPGRLQIWVSGTLKVQVSEGFWYYDSNGDLKYWAVPFPNVDDGRCLDLSSHVPTASGGVDQMRFAVVTFDNDAAAPGFTATDCTARSVMILGGLPVSDIEGAALSAGAMLIGAVRLQTGDTSEATVTEDDFVDLRFWTTRSAAGGAVDSVVAGDGISVDATDPANPIVASTLGWISVKDYGATGDGSTDDTSAVSDAITALNAAGGGVLYFPAGSYLTSGGFTLANPTTVIGDGHGDSSAGGNAATTIQCSSGSVSLFTVTSETALFRDMDLTCTSGTTPTAGAGITVAQTGAGTGRVDFYRLKVRGFYTNVDVGTAMAWTMHGCIIEGPVKYGLWIRNYLLPDGGGGQVTNCTFLGGGYTPDAGIYITSGGGIKIVSTTIVNTYHSGTGYQYGILRVTTGSANSSSILLVSNCSIESCTVNCINLYASSSGVWNYTLLNNIQLRIDGASGWPIDVNAAVGSNLDYLTISNCHMVASDANANAAITLTRVNHAVLSGLLRNGFGSTLSETSCTDIVNLDDSGSITLAADADTLLGISGAELSLDSQNANRVFAGPASGAAADPTFRALVSDDLPASAVTPGTYTNATVVVNAKGIITSASSGTAESGEILVQDGSSAPPVILTNEAEDDFLYEG